MICLLGECTARDRLTDYSDHASALLVVLGWGRHVLKHMYEMTYSTFIGVDIFPLNGVGNILKVIAFSSMFYDV